MQYSHVQFSSSEFSIVTACTVTHFHTVRFSVVEFTMTSTWAWMLYTVDHHNVQYIQVPYTNIE